MRILFVAALVSVSALAADVQTPFGKFTREELETKLRSQEPEELITLGQKVVSDLGTYTYKLVKQERLNGKLSEEQEIQTYVQESPFSVRLHYTKGSKTGRKVAYSPSVNAKAFRVREPGFLEFTGAWWIDIDSGIAKSDSNHTIKEAGMSPLLNRFATDNAHARQLGGYTIGYEGWNEQGLWCTTYTAPNNGVGFGAYKSRICTDLSLGLPLKVETYDLKGELIERYLMSNIVKYSPPSADFFVPSKL